MTGQMAELCDLPAAQARRPAGEEMPRHASPPHPLS
jgi:hypothetical protein